MENSVPQASRVSLNKIAYALMDTGSYSSTQVNGILVEWLVSEGITKSELNEMLYKYLGGLGYSGALNEKLKQWSLDP